MKRIIIFCSVLFYCFSGNLFGQDFGFGFDDDEEESVSGKPVSLNIGGEITAEIVPFVHDFKKNKGNGKISQAISFRDILSGKLNFSIITANIETYASFNLSADSISELWDKDSPLGEGNYTPLIFGEAFLRAFIGKVNIEAGLRKLTWGKADSLGPLDVTNPYDYSDLKNLTELKDLKIARPMAHITWNTGDFSKLEAVFIPNFLGHRFDQNGRWMPNQFSAMTDTVINEILKNPIIGIYINQYPALVSGFTGPSPKFPSTAGLDFFQAGLRFTATVGPVDLGGQYFYGNLFQPNVTINGIDDFISDLIAGNIPPDPLNPYTGNPKLISPRIEYSRYHQIGIDYAQVLFGFNLRSEFALHLTEDLSGDDGAVQNPFLAWSLGFDRDLFWGISANIQCNETIRLLNKKVGKNPVLDAEAGKKITATRFTMQIAKKFLMDKLETRAVVIWDVENSDCYVIPALIWTLGDLSSELSAGIFAGKESGDLGQYWKNSYIKLKLKYTF